MIRTQEDDATDDEPYTCAYGGHDESGCYTLAARKAYGHWWCSEHESRLNYEEDERHQL